MDSGLPEVRILVWDLGRPGKARVSRVLNWLLARRYDVVVLAKCRSASLPVIVEALEGEGYCVLLGGGSFQPSVAVASLLGAEPVDLPGPAGYEHRWVPFRVSWPPQKAGLTTIPGLDQGQSKPFSPPSPFASSRPPSRRREDGVHAGLGQVAGESESVSRTYHFVEALAVHIPYAGESEGLEGKRRYWEAVLEWSRAHQNVPAMILGVFNTGLPADTQGERYRLGSCMQELLDRGWVDCWRQANPGVNDFGWFSHTGNGFRLDHCFFSPALAPMLADAEFDHQARMDGFGASAPLVVNCDL